MATSSLETTRPIREACTDSFNAKWHHRVLALHAKTFPHPSAHTRRLTQPQPYAPIQIDTPGHVDFSYEVGRSLRACQGVALLVDSTQGVQAQTIAHHRSATGADLAIVWVLTKTDLPLSNTEQVTIVPHSLTHSLTHPRTRSPTHPLTHPLIHSLTHSFTHQVVWGVET